MVTSLYLKRNKKGQAAIEFLMTYGWMLLVVLIVGALIFSFVDFGQLLPNTLELSNNLRGEATQIQATATTNHVLLTISYNGNDRVQINSTDATGNFIQDPITGTCGIGWIKNIDTDTSAGAAASTYGIPNGATHNSGTANVVFLRGQEGLVEFNCTPATGNLFANDVFDGNIRLTMTNARTEVPIRSEGNIRFSVSE